MIDLHSHILPYVDDGAENIEKTMEMLRYSVEEGTTDVVFTPHANILGVYENFDLEKLYSNFYNVKENIKKENLPIKIYLGMEVYGDYNIREALENKLLTLNESKYMLVEFPFDAEPDHMFYVLNAIHERKLKPIIAHPERYYFVQSHPEIAFEWNKMGYLLQINKGSINGTLGRMEQQTGELLLRNNLTQIIASDCHDMEYRKPGLEKIYRYISKKYSEGYAEVLMNINPRRILQNKKALIINPQMPR